MIGSDRTTLRPWRDGDAETVVAAFDCPGIRQWHVRRMDSPAVARAWISAWATRWDEETDAGWAIVEGGDRPIGQDGWHDMHLHARLRTDEARPSSG